ncbi:unnamed protein product [Nezara viridula]|uniref:Uncharacterized protein n=1 Tax=Nezara viridula TaxID=85310 RepID=A0A9P0H0B4_NEZVI|nr:unnamed protein product [Nezara viridula]
MEKQWLTAAEFITTAKSGDEFLPADSEGIDSERTDIHFDSFNVITSFYFNSSINIIRSPQHLQFLRNINQ